MTAGAQPFRREPEEETPSGTPESPVPPLDTEGVAGAEDESENEGALGKIPSVQEEESEATLAAQSHVISRGPFSSLTRRILALNLLALAILVGGLMFLDQYRQSLVEANIEALETQGEIFAEALGEGAVAELPYTTPFLLPDLARLMMRRLVSPLHARARLFDADGKLLVDSWFMGGQTTAMEIEPLPAPTIYSAIGNAVSDALDWIINAVHPRRRLEHYHENAKQRASDYSEVVAALRGDTTYAIRAAGKTGMILSVAVPVKRYKQVVGAIMLSTGSSEIEAALRSVRIDILKVFGVAFAVTVLLSLYLASTIARPIRRLAVAADEVTHGHGRKAAIPDFTVRGDEIGDLSGSLRDMTAALWARMDAIEGFAADVAHEIKNPLTSLRSAVETAARIKDPNSQRELMRIILEDVQRLDRLISDISDASRLDAELSRAEFESVDIGGLLTMLADLHRNTRKPDDPVIELDLEPGPPLLVQGIESRLVQVFRNLVSNAVSFSPPDGTITMRARRRDSYIVITIEDEGPGIPEGKKDAIFDRFYTERPAEEKFGTHSGLGLSISRQIIEAQKGSITADNRRDDLGRVRGARFTVILPADESGKGRG